MKMKKIAIIGSGIAGISSAHYLPDDAEITIYEKLNRPGGHVDTHYVIDSVGNSLAIDTGYIMFNQSQYPTFMEYLKELRISPAKSEMSFRMDSQHLKADTKHRSMFLAVLKSKSIFSPQYWQLLKNGLAFHQCGSKDCALIDPNLTVVEYGKSKGYSEVFIEEYLVVMAAGLMSQSIGSAREFPMRRVLNYLKNHGLICLMARHQWLYVPGGYQRYLEPVLAKSNVKLELSTPVSAVETLANGKVVVTSGLGNVQYDAVIMACEVDTTLKLLQNPTELETKILSPFLYRTNNGFLHQDESIMPANKEGWGAFSLHVNPSGAAGCFTIWLNPILGLPTADNYFMTLNPWMPIAPDKVVQPLSYRHLQLTTEVFKAQGHLDELNQSGPVYFAGSYFNYFHENAVASAKKVAQFIAES
ncbi:NAD(P)-binding protein [bacterium]|nr:NAD(P)-binding protein [bacterium]NCQ55131.1 NAD(P)-binding protein [Candidatus Parcubacteria bacterium]NCS67356.1 NAD(P)-binding protein [Candidatus Peregrinibacteria bacterium]NCS96611.1 NAD(P)-binding protein [bacterium]